MWKTKSNYIIKIVISKAATAKAEIQKICESKTTGIGRGSYNHRGNSRYLLRNGGRRRDECSDGILKGLPTKKNASETNNP